MISRWCSTTCSHLFCPAVLAILFLLGPLAAAAQQPSSSPQQTEPPASSDEPAPNAQPANPPSLITPLTVQREESPYHAITRRQRLRWFITNSIGPPHLAGGLFTSAFGTALDRPKEYGPHWGGFADRYGMRMTGIVTGNAIEASAGYYFHEDPRYFRVPERPFKSRIANVARLTANRTYMTPFCVPARALPEEWPPMLSRNSGRTSRSTYFAESNSVLQPTKKARHS